MEKTNISARLAEKEKTFEAEVLALKQKIQKMKQDNDKLKKDKEQLVEAHKKEAEDWEEGRKGDEKKHARELTRLRKEIEEVKDNQVYFYSYSLVLVGLLLFRL